jgi:hypothetical protein
MATSTLFTTDFLNQLFKQIQEQSISFAVEFSKMIVEMIWLSLKPYWSYLAIGFFLVLVWLTIRAMLGEWGPLGSFLFHVFYLVFLGIAIFIKGWKILFNPLFDLLSYSIYLISYKIVGLILIKFRR